MKRLLLVIGLIICGSVVRAAGPMMIPNQVLKLAAEAAGGGGDPCSVKGTTVAYRAHTTSTAGTTTNKTVTKPTGTTSGDLLIIGAYADSDTWMGSPPTAPTGFALYKSTSLTTTSPDTNSFIWWKIAGGSEPADYTLTYGSAYSQVYVAAYKDNNANASCGPFESDFATDVGTDGTSTVEMTTAYTNTLAIISQANFDGNRQTPPTGWAERFDSGNMALQDEEYPTAGSTGNQSLTVAGTADYALHMVGILD